MAGEPHSIKIIDTEICSARLKAEHPELFHYTGRGGFEPIVKTNTLWATHFRHLNDDLEIATLKPQLQETMSAVLGREVKKQNTGTRNQYYHAGGAAPMARDFVKSLYASTFERDDPQFAVDACQSAFKFDPVSASNFDPLERRALTVALASSELAGVAETRRARVA
jgi:hypothetical protein